MATELPEAWKNAYARDRITKIRLRRPEARASGEPASVEAQELINHRPGSNAITKTNTPPSEGLRS